MGSGVSKTFLCHPGEVFAIGIGENHAKIRIRRVIDVQHGRVFYSKGTDRSFCCKKSSFRKWARFHHAHRFVEA